MEGTRISFWFEHDIAHGVTLVAVRDGEALERTTWATLDAAIERAKALIHRVTLRSLT